MRSESSAIIPMSTLPVRGTAPHPGSPVSTREVYAAHVTVTDSSPATTPCAQIQGGAQSDPLITGFDGKSFHFDETGEFTLLSSADGFKVSVTGPPWEGKCS